MTQLGIFNGALAVDPTDEQFECMTTDEAMTMPLDSVDEDNLPVVLMEMCMGPQLTEAYISNIAAMPDITDEVRADITCIIEQTASLLDGATLEERLVAARSDLTPSEEEAMAEACDISDEDMDALEAVFG